MRILEIGQDYILVTPQILLDLLGMVFPNNRIRVEGEFVSIEIKQGFKFECNGVRIFLPQHVINRTTLYANLMTHINLQYIADKVSKKIVSRSLRFCGVA